MDISVPEADRLLEELLPHAHMLRQRTAGRYYYHDLLREHARAKMAKELDVHDVTGQVHLRVALRLRVPGLSYLTSYSTTTFGHSVIRIRPALSV